MMAIPKGSSVKVERRPITPAKLLQDVVSPVLADLARRGVPGGPTAARLLVAIADQETGLNWTRQVLADGSPGPATGRWQFERGGGVRGVLTHARTKAIARALVAKRGLPPEDERAVWTALEDDDRLACAFARLLIFTDSAPLPLDEIGGWRLYLRTWRPGKPHPGTWGGAFEIAGLAVAAAPPTMFT